ncbi:MAG: enoyl-CoA hydratase/isomerase family protein [Hyphomicrobiaceae bacterium]|nr:enoyl-CoA hydratase/isomerase family protein [Hyphomicrobiaceae bacterium]
MTNTVSQKVQGRVVELTLARPQAGNAFDAHIVEDLLSALDRINANTCDTIVFRGEGKGFCGGLDLSELETETDATFLARLVRIELLLQRVASLPQETVAMAHRFAFGAGADLFVACRRRIAAPGTRFSFPGVRFGIALGTGRLARSVGPDAARRLLAATAPISLETAVSVGLVQETAEADTFDEIVETLSKTDTSLDPRMARIVAERLDPGFNDADLAALVRSAGEPGLRDRIAYYARLVAQARRR